MVEQPYVDEFECRFQAPGDPLVGLAGLGDARGVVVSQDDGRRVDRQRFLDDFPRIDAGAVDGAAKQLVEPQYAMPVVEVKTAKALVPEVAQPGQQERLRIRRAANAGARGQGLLE